ncbi:MAG: homocysteine S-methyltransferase family protein [Deltaproteobacteria bacterium]|nr:homocysteine S-methyltransferase family protein [Deltaproteobacteria bacterium]
MRPMVLDGPMGTELAARGVATPVPIWSAAALETAPDVVAAIHRDYAAAGATVHTANTFRTKRRQLGERWEALARRAVRIAREAVPRGHRVAGSVAPLEDCYRPDLSPPLEIARPEHRELARTLADAGVDLILCETFPSPVEALVAVEEAVATGLETWLALTAGPEGDLLEPAEIERTAREAALRGAAIVLVDCVALGRIDRFVEALARSGVAFGAYANAGAADDRVGWRSPPPPGGPELYAEAALRWVALGATVVGGCCGTGPEHIAAIVRRLRSR